MGSKDEQALPQSPVELIFDMLPTSNVFDEGHRIRISIAGADTLPSPFK